MPRYFFHVWTDGDCAPDAEGSACADAAAARGDALRAAHELLRADIGAGRHAVAHRIVVEDEAGATVTEVAFSMSVTGLG